MITSVRMNDVLTHGWLHAKGCSRLCWKEDMYIYLIALCFIIWGIWTEKNARVFEHSYSLLYALGESFFSGFEHAYGSFFFFMLWEKISFLALNTPMWAFIGVPLSDAHQDWSTALNIITSLVVIPLEKRDHVVWKFLVLTSLYFSVYSWLSGFSLIILI